MAAVFFLTHQIFTNFVRAERRANYTGNIDSKIFEG